MKEKKIQVLIVDDQDLTSQLFKVYLEETGRYHVCEILTDAQMAVLYCGKNHVDLILMDVYTTPGAEGNDGIHATAQIKGAYPQVKVIIMTGMPEAHYIRRAKEAGAESFWYKEATREDFIEVCDRTMDGESLYPGTSPDLPFGLARTHELTDREIIILREVVRGASNQEIAEKLYLSTATIKQHISSLITKTGFKSRTELAVRAREAGFIIPD